MPVTNGMGHSVATRAKQEALRYIMRAHYPMAMGAIRKQRWVNQSYMCVDLTAGAGNLDGEPGSPVILCEEAERAGLIGSGNFSGVFVEKLESNYLSLRNALEPWLEKGILLFHEDHKKTISRWCSDPVQQKRMGIVYMDSNGQPPWDSIDELSRCKMFDRMDLLINVPCSNVKRQLSQTGMRPSDRMRAIKKKYWLVREPVPQDKWQWSFLLGTNWVDFPSFSKIGMYRIDSPAGADILQYLDTTNEEKRCA